MDALPKFMPVLLSLVLLCTIIRLTSAADTDFLKFRVYWHDVVIGSNRTAIRIAEAPSSNSSSTSFGVVVAIDDPLTNGPKLGSKQLGRAQGTYIFADQKTYGLLMNMNFVFTGGDYNGSAISIFGRNEVLRPVREMAIVGGTGKFRMARGYVEARTYDPLSASGETIVQYSIFVKT